MREYPGQKPRFLYFNAELPLSMPQPGNLINIYCERLLFVGSVVGGKRVIDEPAQALTFRSSLLGGKD